jgi:hypothetical protein
MGRAKPTPVPKVEAKAKFRERSCLTFSRNLFISFSLSSIFASNREDLMFSRKSWARSIPIE